MKIQNIGMTVRVDVDGEALHPAFFGRKTKDFRPVTVLVNIFESMEKDSIEFFANVTGHFQTKDGSDFQEPATVAFSQSEVNWEYLSEHAKTYYQPAPDYIVMAVDLAKARYNRATS